MRSAGGTKSPVPGVVTRATKSVIEFFVAPSFQEGRGSVCAWTCFSVGPSKTTIVAATVSKTRRLMAKEITAVLTILRFV